MINFSTRIPKPHYWNYRFGVQNGAHPSVHKFVADDLSLVKKLWNLVGAKQKPVCLTTDKFRFPFKATDCIILAKSLFV